jgi:hypothetical protein
VLCGTASNALDAARSASPQGFKFKNIRWIEFFMKKRFGPIFKFETLNLNYF